MNILTEFKIVVPWVLDAEGGFVNDKNDRGGPTKYGISLPFLKNIPDHDGDGIADGDVDRDGDVDIDDIRALSVDDAVERYRVDIWEHYKCHLLPHVVAVCLFDGLVNHRPRAAKILVQQALRVDIDGFIGSASIDAAERCNQAYFIPDYMSYRAQLYADIVRANSTQARFERGWYRRLFLLQAYLYNNVIKSL